MKQHLSEQELVSIIKQLDMEMAQFSDQQETKTEHSEAVDGYIRITGQQILVQNPANGGKMAMIRPKWPVRLFINGQETTEETSVCEEDRIEWQVTDLPLFEVRVPEDAMSVRLLVRARELCAWRLVESGPRQNVEVAVEEDRDTVLESISLSDIINKIIGLGVKVKLDVDAILQELEHPTGVEMVVAEGKPAIPGTDAKLELYFPEQVTHQFFEVNGQIDYRNHSYIPSVSKGQLIAKKIPMEQGQSGYNVYGKTILPRQPKDIILVGKPNVRVTEKGEVFALKDGRPRLTGGRIKTIDISTAHFVYGNVDLESGNIVFSGDVIIYGNVTDNMIVESLGSVYVYGNVYRATITATGSIYVRGNVLAGKLYSGYFGVLFNRLYQTCKALSEQLTNLSEASRLLSRALERRGQEVRWGQMVLLLIEQKFREIPGKMAELQSILSNIKNVKQEMFDKLSELAGDFLHPLRLIRAASMNYLLAFLRLVNEVCRDLEQMQESEAKTMINQCHNAELKSNGDILILGEGVVLSDLYAANDIRFMQNDGVCRGSRLEAKRSIEARIVGGQTGTSSLLKAHERVAVKKMFFGKVLVGRQMFMIDQLVEDRVFTGRAAATNPLATPG